MNLLYFLMPDNCGVILGGLHCKTSFIVCFSAVLEFVCDLMYNVTMSRIHTSVQGLVLQAVLKQEIAFFDATPTGESCHLRTVHTELTPLSRVRSPE